MWYTIYHFGYTWGILKKQGLICHSFQLEEPEYILDLILSVLFFHALRPGDFVCCISFIMWFGETLGYALIEVEHW